jgi:hypothetical protein
VTPEMKQELLNFYGDLNAPIDTKKKPEEWQQTLEEFGIERASDRSYQCSLLAGERLLPADPVRIYWQVGIP